MLGETEALGLCEGETEGEMLGLTDGLTLGETELTILLLPNIFLHLLWVRKFYSHRITIRIDNAGVGDISSSCQCTICPPNNIRLGRSSTNYG